MQAKARVEMTIDLEVESVWGEDCPIKQVNSQAAREALDTISRALERCDFRLVGPMKVRAIIVEGEVSR